MRNAWDLLEMCAVRAPAPRSTREYLDHGCTPSFVWLWNPALGPLWAVVAQKVRGGALAAGAEVDLEVAELCWRDVDVDGSLLVRTATTPGGHALWPYTLPCSRLLIQSNTFSWACA